MTKPHVLMVGEVPDLLRRTAAAEFHLHEVSGTGDIGASLSPLRDKVRGLITTIRSGFDRKLLQGLPKLEMISVYGTGLQSTFDIEGAKERGIVLAHTATDGTDGAVADLALAFLLALARRIGPADRFVRAGNWASSKFQLSTNVSGKRAGIVGLGFIGRKIARRLAGFDVEVCYHGRARHHDVDYAFYPDLKKLAADVDFLFVSCRGGAETTGMINADVLNALGHEGLYIHVAQARIYNEVDLIRVLKLKQVAGAAIDTFPGEPNVSEEFLKLDNVLLSPHVGAMTNEVLANRCFGVVRNLQAHFSGHAIVSRLI